MITKKDSLRNPVPKESEKESSVKVKNTSAINTIEQSKQLSPLGSHGAGTIETEVEETSARKLVSDKDATIVSPHGSAN